MDFTRSVSLKAKDQIVINYELLNMNTSKFQAERDPVFSRYNRLNASKNFVLIQLLDGVRALKHRFKSHRNRTMIDYLNFFRTKMQSTKQC